MSRWKQGDTKPDMVIRCFDDAGRPANLSNAATIRVIVVKAGVPQWDREILDRPSDGVVVVPLQPSDVADTGQYRVKIKVVWPDGSIQHYPPADDWMTMLVTR